MVLASDGYIASVYARLSQQAAPPRPSGLPPGGKPCARKPCVDASRWSAADETVGMHAGTYTLTVMPAAAGEWRLQLTVDGADAGVPLSLHAAHAPLRGCDCVLRIDGAEVRRRSRVRMETTDDTAVGLQPSCVHSCA
jgi:hypothetical protein